MSFRVPVASTSVGAEGMHLTHEKNILLADEALSLGSRLSGFHRIARFGPRLSGNGLKNVEEHFWNAAAKHSLEELLIDLEVLRSAIRPGTLDRRARANSRG